MDISGIKKSRSIILLYRRWRLIRHKNQILYDFIVRGFSPNVSFLMAFLFTSAQWLLIALLFWKKGLETALACEMVIVTITYLIAPLVILAIGA